jgi:alpha,alpha-trehalose phosphorylase
MRPPRPRARDLPEWFLRDLADRLHAASRRPQPAQAPPFAARSRPPARPRGGPKGVLFPWRTINGDEASAYYAASTAQYHIDADIVFAAHRYAQLSGDLDFLGGGFAEIAVETARLWADLGFYSERKGGRFCIDPVTGPDEYNTVVNNNAYTNLMAQ